jgi:ubiquitin-protein ligase
VENLCPQVLRRVTKEVLELAEEPPEGIKVYINEEDLTDIQATIEGPGNVISWGSNIPFYFYFHSGHAILWWDV